MKKILFAGLVAVALTACGDGGGQSDECKNYIACAEAVTPGTKASLENTYGEDGTCWSTTDLAADACTAACTTAFDALKAGAGKDKAECK